MFYSEIVQRADVIVTGTVVRLTSRYENGRATIRTYVELADLTFHKGRRRDKLTIGFEGGQVGDDRLVVSGMPQLAVGKRYLLYVDGTRSPEKLSPIVGFHQGAFEIVLRDGRETLLNMAGQELVGVQNDRFVFRAKARRHDPARPEVPQPGVEDHTVKLADPNADAIEARMEAERERAAQRARLENRLPELPADPAHDSPGSLPPANVAGPAAPERDRSLATPLVIEQEFDTGARMSVSDMVLAARRYIR